MSIDFINQMNIINLGQNFGRMKGIVFNRYRWFTTESSKATSVNSYNQLDENPINVKRVLSRNWLICMRTLRNIEIDPVDLPNGDVKTPILTL